jgi:coenzyme PQQ biosynthesis protein PqqD
MTPVNLQHRVGLAPGVRWQIDRATGDAVLLFPEGILLLNETAREVVARCDGKKNTAEIVSELAAEYDVTAAEVKNDVLECLLHLQDKRLVVFTP